MNEIENKDEKELHNWLKKAFQNEVHILDDITNKDSIWKKNIYILDKKFKDTNIS